MTVYVSELTEQNENDWRSDALAHSLAAIGAVQARAGGVCTFRPNSEVEYLDIILGADTFAELHGACVQELGQWHRLSLRSAYYLGAFFDAGSGAAGASDFR